MRLILALILIGIASNLIGQTRSISGKVIGSEFRTKKDNAPYEFWDIPEAKIFWRDSLIGSTDNKGQFRIELAKTIDAIRIGWIGMYPETIQITDNCDYLEVILLPEVIYDYVTQKKEERLRKKDRAILPELYRKAFETGIFRQEEPCR